MPYSSCSRLHTFINRTRFVAGLAILFLATQCVAVEIEGVAEFQSTNCWVELDAEAKTECGWVIVPERWEHPKARKLKLPVVIYRALNPDPSLAPVIYLSGGPGFPALGPDGKYISSWRWTADNRFPGRTLILFDPRGVGLGSPKLECREADEPTMWWPVSNTPDEFDVSPALLQTAITTCAKRHRAAGYQLSAFNTLQSASDVEALRRVLKLGDVVLFGISYGTRVALTVMKLHPDNIKAALLDSVLPPQAAHSWSDGRIFGPVLDRLFAACSQYKQCASAYPDLCDRFLRVLEQLAQKPVFVEIWNQKSSEPLYVRVDHWMFANIIYSEMYHASRIPILPTLISGVAQGEHWRLKQHVENTVYGDFPDKYDVGADIVIRCNDGWTVFDQRPNLNEEPYSYLGFLAESGREFWDCAAWFTQEPGTINRDPVVSEIPALLLAGAFDPVTTVEHTEMAAQTLRTSHVFVFPASGHVQVASNECSWAIIDEFLSKPAARPDPICLTSVRQPAFLAIGGN